MMIKYNIKDRKSFVKALEEITGAKAKYLYVPSLLLRWAFSP
ncbi:hypothetical protein PEPNEM18_01115 [Aedoeadaptatus nemausensis]|uniref:Uncharacterized protein n=1 Tax=Aedoeadaptatus nemausensis TaxID=2582829 RepID=A0A6V6Y481_9FIRM|nr:hypothetical protein PEPNEM18_01115 [Peptoniphilus nemausensis]